MRLAEITQEQYESIVGKEFTDDNLFAPIQINDIWYISEQEVLFCNKNEFAWVNNLPIVVIE
jgi:hypothetical protein